MLSITLYHVFLAVAFIVCFVAFVFVTRGRRPISNILAWLFFIFLIPYIGIPLFFLIGQRKLNWILDKKRELITKKQECSDNASSNDILLDAFGVLPVTTNNRVQLISDGIQAYKIIMASIENAQHSILISTYLLNNDEVGNGILKALTIKAKAGIQVCVLLDTIGCFLKMPARKLKPLRQAGGCVRYIMPLFHAPFRGRANLRDHRKIMVFDGQHAYVGGMNLATEYMGPTENKKRWADVILKIDGEMINDLISIFESDWKFANSNMEYKRYKRHTISHPQVGNAVLRTVASGPDTIGDRLYDAVLSAIFNAKQSIYLITPYFVIDDTLQKALMIATRRGIKVNIIIPRRSNHPLPDLVRSISLRKLYNEGAKIYFYPKMLHAKAMIFDDKLSIVGSANLDLRSLLLNFEISCFIYSKPEIAMVQQWAKGLCEKSSTKINPPRLWHMWLEDAAQLLKPLL